MSSEDYLSALRKRSETASGVACRCAVSGFIFSEKAAISASHAFSGLSPSSPNRQAAPPAKRRDVPAVRQWRRPRKTFCPSTPPRSGHSWSQYFRALRLDLIHNPQVDFQNARTASGILFRERAIRDKEHGLRCTAILRMRRNFEPERFGFAGERRPDGEDIAVPVPVTRRGRVSVPVPRS